MRLFVWCFRQNNMEFIGDMMRQFPILDIDGVVVWIADFFGKLAGGNLVVVRPAMLREHFPVFFRDSGLFNRQQRRFELGGCCYWLRVAVSVIFVIFNIFFMGRNFKKPLNLVSGIIFAYNRSEERRVGK